MTPITMNRRSVLRLGAGTALSLAQPFAFARAAAPDAITIANTAGNLNVVMRELMRQQKFLESFDLAPKVMDVADGTKIVAGIVSGDVDCSTMSGFGQTFPAVEKGATLKVLAGGALPPTLAVYSAKPDLKTVADLAGRTVGTGSIGALLHQLMVALLVKKGVNLQSVRFVNIGSSADVFRATAAGVVDAGLGDIAILDDPERFHVHGVEGGNLSAELPEFTYQGAWTSQQKIDTKRPLLVRALAAYARLYRFAQKPDSHDAFMSAWAAALKDPERRDGEALWNYVQKYKPFAVDLVLSPARIEYLQKLNVQVKVQNAVLPFERVADMSIAQDALKLL
jgi:ABC-type nitrate/sulfonate/bicarbonate transport system substrate-binding protein